MKTLFKISLFLLSLAFLSGCGKAGDEDLGQIQANIIFQPDDAQAVLDSMSTGQKAAQLIMASCHEPGSAQRAADFGVGGLCLYADSFKDKSAQQVRRMCAQLQNLAPLPLLISVDEEGGSVCRVSCNPELRQLPFSSPLSLYEQGGLEALQADTAEKSRFLLDLGINLNLAPVCDVPLSADDYIYSRSLGLDPLACAQAVSQITSTMKAEGIGSCLKHFPGYGGSSDTHLGMAYDERPYEDFVSRDFLPFQSGIAAGADSVLVSHNIVRCMDDKLPASLSPEVHRILREDLGFQGLIISDDMFMGAIRQFAEGENMAVQAVLAGNDLVCCEDFEQSAAAITAAIEDGSIPIEQVDASVLRILSWKIQLGLDICPK